jgi:hypothetical protein
VKFRIVKAQIETAAERVPSPKTDAMIEGVTNPASVTRRIYEHRADRPAGVPTPVRSTDAPAPPSMADMLREKK